MLFSFVFGLDENVIEIYNHKNVVFLCQDLGDIVLEYSRYIGQSKRHYLVLEVAIAGSESCLLFLTFSNPHPMVGMN